MNLNLNHEQFIRYRDDDSVYRLYFETGCFTLSKRKCGSLIHNIIDKCRTYNARFRNDFKIFENHVEVYCYEIKTQAIKTLLLDIEDWVKYHRYYISGQFNYPLIFFEGERWRIHRLIMGLSNKVDTNDEHCIVDHLNGNEYDNRKSNLRIVNFELNSKNHGFFNPNNPSGVYGVSLTPDKRAWRVRFGHKDHYPDVVFDKLSDAVKYRYKKAIELGFYFREGSTTIENHIEELAKSGK